MSTEFNVGVTATAAIIIMIGLIIGDYWKDHNAKIVELIKNGTPAIEAMCAMQDDYGTHPTCIVLAAKR